MRTINSGDRAEIKKIMLTYDKVSKERLDSLVSGFIDLAIDYEYSYTNLSSEIYYYMKEYGWL